VDLEEYKKDIGKFKGQVDSFNTIPYLAEVGIFSVLSEALKQELMPSPVAVMLALKKLLPELMGTTSKALLDTLDEVVPIVTGSPNTVEEFVKKKAVVAESQVAIEKYKTDQIHLLDMAHLMDEMQWPTPSEEQAHIIMVAENMKELENGIEVAQGREEVRPP
jgi:hypothetical protein